MFVLTFPRMMSLTLSSRYEFLLSIQVQQLVEMGFSEPLVRSALEAVGGDENLALEKLCSG